MNEIPLPSQIPRIVDELECRLVDLDRLPGEAERRERRAAVDVLPPALAPEEPRD